MQQPLANSQSVIERYQLRPHPEGGWFRELHRSGERVNRADESWHFIGGAPLELLLSPERDQAVTVQQLGFAAERADLLPVAVVPAGWWQAARSLGAWSLVSCCVGPGFDVQDFELDTERQLHS